MKTQIFTLLLIGIFLPQMVFSGNVVDESTAATVARHFYFERINQLKDVPFDDISIEKIELKMTEETPAYYCVNLQEGFVLISAFKNTFPALAYSFDGKFQITEKEENISAWLAQYERQICYAQENNIEATDRVKQAWEKYSDPEFLKNYRVGKLRSVEPMLVSKWDQGTYYNGQCPADPNGVSGHCVTGCVATALGQLLYYFRFPQSGTGSYSYEHPDYGTISANFEEADYDYNQMMNQLNAPNPETAELIFHLGVACDMVYGPQSSGMYNHKAAYALKSFFRFSPETQYVYRDSTSMDWDSLLVTHLDQKIPLYYAGWSVPNINGHAFICDGYQGENFYHFNWGWSGSNDGYFYTGELTPGGNNFNLAQELIINAFPDTINNPYPTFCDGSKTFTFKQGTFTDGSFPVYDYQNGADCQWLIDPQNEQDSVTNITLSFQRFDTENDTDIVNIYDGETNSAPLLGSFSGNDIPPNISSTSNKLLVTFLSDLQNTRPGFFVSFTSNQPGWCSGSTFLTAQQGEFSDGSHSFYYNNNATCMWHIQPANANNVTVYFTSFDTEAGEDHVKIYDAQNMALLADYSGYYSPDELPPSVTSPSGKIFFIFHANEAGRAQGWDAGFYSNLVSIDENIDNPVINIFPIPAQDVLNIDINQQFKNSFGLSLINQLGKSVFNQNYLQLHASQVSINISELPAGVYFLKVSTQDQEILKKVLIY